jgi:hypothetical protein
MDTSDKVGITVAVRPQALNDFKNLIMPILFKKLSKIPLPNFSEGGFDMTDVAISALYCPVEQLKIAFTEDSISISSTGLSIKLELTVKKDLPFGLKVEAPTIATSHNSDLSFVFKTEYQYSYQRTKIKIPEVKACVNNLNVTIDGKLGAFAAVITNIVLQNQAMKKDINEKVSAILQESFEDELNHILKNIDYKSDIPGTYLGADYHVVQNPLITSNFLSFAFNGTFYNTKLPNQQPQVPDPAMLPTSDENSTEMVQFFISEHVVDSLLYSIFTAGLLSVTIDSNMIPSDSAYQLNTSSLNSLFNGMEDLYGYDTPCQLKLSAKDNPPSIRIKPNAILGTVAGQCEILVETKEGVKTALLYGVVIEFEGKCRIESYTVYPEATRLRFVKFKILEKQVADVDDDDILIDIFNTILGLAVSALNKNFLSKGFPLPSIPFTTLEEATVVMNDGYLKIGATAKLDPEIGSLLD